MGETVGERVGTVVERVGDSGRESGDSGRESGGQWGTVRKKWGFREKQWIEVVSICTSRVADKERQKSSLNQQRPQLCGGEDATVSHTHTHTSLPLTRSCSSSSLTNKYSLKSSTSSIVNT